MESAHVTQMVGAECRARISQASVEDSANRVLVVSSAPEDRGALAQLLVSHPYPQHWTSSVAEAAEWLRRMSARVVICDDQLSDGRWQDLWEVLRWTPIPPVFIVSAYWADERLWAEVLNMGAYDVLAKPYRSAEVARILDQASRAFGSLRLNPEIQRSQSTPVRDNSEAVVVGSLPGVAWPDSYPQSQRH
jgi:DNA-binding response OmpR family regulator